MAAGLIRHLAVVLSQRGDFGPQPALPAVPPQLFLLEFLAVHYTLIFLPAPQKRITKRNHLLLLGEAPRGALLARQRGFLLLKAPPRLGLVAFLPLAPQQHGACLDTTPAMQNPVINVTVTDRNSPVIL